MSVDNMLWIFFVSLKSGHDFFMFYFTFYANKKCIVLLILFVCFCHKTFHKNYFSVCISTFFIIPAHFNNTVYNSYGFIHYLKGSYDAFLKIIILCIWCNRICWHALMFKKHIIFQILYIIVGPLCPASLVFYKAPPSDKRSLLWLANWHSALWLAEHHKPRRKCNAHFHNCQLQLSKWIKTVIIKTCGGVFEWADLGGHGRVLTLIKNISLVLRL